MKKKKYQVFVSSTYLDLKEERQAAVEAILSNGHIPAGMELFKAGNKSQMETIKRWINESDIYLLILGGRYGSVEESSHKSYTQIEYEYAVDNDIPIFSVILNESFLHKKAAEMGKDKVFEKEYKVEYEDFEKMVMTRMIKLVDDEKDIKIAILESINEISDEYSHLTGWTRGDQEKDRILLESKVEELTKENVNLKKTSNKNEFTYEKYITSEEKIAQGNKVIELEFYCYDSNHNILPENIIEFKWDEIINIIGTYLLQARALNNLKQYLEDFICGDIIEPTQKENLVNVGFIKFKYKSFEAIKIQLLALGIISLTITNEKEYVKYTEKGIETMFNVSVSK